MRCAWQAYLNLLPSWLRPEVDRLGYEKLLETRLRLHCRTELITEDGSVWLDRQAEREDLSFPINIASGYSPWAAASIAQGYITAAGGHRIGVCGQATLNGGNMCGISNVSSISIRAAKDFPGIARGTDNLDGSILLIGPPGSGKTTLLRDLIRTKAERMLISVIDERAELFPTVQKQYCFEPGKRMDIMSGCTKQQGIEAVLRSMNPQMIAMDEITASEDCEALLHAGWCGVKLLATAHAGSKQDLFARSVYKPLLKKRLFDYLIILKADKTWNVERIDI